MVAAVELDDPVASRDAAGEADRRHGGLGARGDETHLFAHPGTRRTDRLGQQHLARGSAPRRSCPTQPPPWMVPVTMTGCACPEEDGAVRLDQVDVAGPLGVDDVGALTPHDGVGRPAHRITRRTSGRGGVGPPPGMTRCGAGEPAAPLVAGAGVQSLECFGRPPRRREVGEDEVRAGPLERGQLLQGHRRPVNPSPGAAAACTMEYSPLTWYAASGTGTLGGGPPSAHRGTSWPASP